MRPHFYQHNSAYPAFNRQRIVTPGKNGTPGYTVSKVLGAEAIVSGCGSLSVHCGCYTETRYANAPYPMAERHILKDR